MISLFCPITGLQVFTQSEWQERELGEYFSANFYIIGESILYSNPVGAADLKATKASLKLNEDVARAVAGGTGPYVQIEDYAAISKATIQARKYFIDQMVLRETEVPMIEKTRARLRDRLTGPENLDYFVVDVSALEGGSRKVRQRYMESLKKWHERFPIRMYIFPGVNTYMKTAARLANMAMPFKIKIARDPDHAFALIREDQRTHHRSVTPSTPDEIDTYRDQLLGVIGGIDWEQPGFTAPSDMADQRHPFYEVFQAIKLIKTEMDDLFTTRQQMQEELAESEKKYRELFEKGSDLLCTHDLDGTLLETNLAFKKGYGWDGELPPGLNLRDLIPERYRPGFDDYLKRIQQTGHDAGNMVVTTAAGEEIVLEYTTVLVKDDHGNPLYVQGSARDITDRIHAEQENKRLQEQLKQKHKMEAIATLTGGIAHDYNNLLSIIMGNLSLIRESVPPGSHVADFLNEMETASLKVRDLTHELMALSKGEAPVKRVGTLTELLKGCADVIPADAGITVTKRIADDLWLVPHDPHKLGSVFRNVVTNAVEAMPEGGILTLDAQNLTIEHAPTDPALPLEPGPYVRIRIHDQGRGIRPEHLDKVYDPYFSTKPMGVQKGMGLGPATAYAIVKKHGGHMAIDSSPDRGTSVQIYLPAQSSSETVKDPAEPLSQPSTDHPKPETPKLLVMDDEKMLRNLAHQMFPRLGYDVETVRDGKEAIDVYQRRMDSGEPFDVVIPDLTVKGKMGGEQAVGELLKIDPNIRAIVSSGYYNDPVMSDYNSYGFRAALAKPYELKRVKETLEKVLT